MSSRPAPDAGERSAVLAVLLVEHALHPCLAPGDVAKLLYQAVFGLDHWRADPDGFARRLRREWSALDPQVCAGVSPLQVIDPDGHTARLHLAPVKARGGRCDHVLELMLAQPGKPGSRERLERLWAHAITLARAGLLAMSPEDLEALDPAADIPRHGERYGPAAYRVVNDVADHATASRLQSLLGLAPVRGPVPGLAG